MTPDEAIEIVARQAFANHGGEPQWADYPGIGANDWRKIQVRVSQLAALNTPRSADYPAAYELLAERATTGGTEDDR
jgi:hypothetical protein